jgi:hypothetical protein
LPCAIQPGLDVVWCRRRERALTGGLEPWWDGVEWCGAVGVGVPDVDAAFGAGLGAGAAGFGVGVEAGGVGGGVDPGAAGGVVGGGAVDGGVAGGGAGVAGGTAGFGASAN